MINVPNNINSKNNIPLFLVRIYIKKVKKFPEYAVDVSLEKKQMKVAMDKAFMILRNEGINYGGQERYGMIGCSLVCEAIHASLVTQC